MAIKKARAKEEEAKEETKKETKASRYYFAVGRRKKAVAQVKLFQVEKMEMGIEINGRKLEGYFGLSRLSDVSRAPLVSIGQESKFDVSAKVQGGGVSAQAEAVRLAIARALVKFNGEYKKTLRDLGYLTRDARVVERKKPGLKKARKSPQWAKR
jgi:small subunit ribosomal protein S9